MTLFAAAKKDKISAAALAALEALDDNDDGQSHKEQFQAALEKKKKKPELLALVDLLDDDTDDDEPQLSRKELLKLKKNGGVSPNSAETVPKQLSKKELALEKALEMEALDSQRQQEEDSSSSSNDGTAPLSKKELKAQQKKEEKLQAKLDKKLAKKQAAAEEETDDDEEESSSSSPTVATTTADNAEDDIETDAAPEEPEITLEDKIRKERPPPRIRVMEGVQPGYTSLRLENVGITFRNQVVLKDVTWGVQTGDRIGLVGANGAGMFDQTTT
jgi:hypothetical protein